MNSVMLLLHISIAFPVLADPRSETITALQSQTNVPVEFPRILPYSEDHDTYLNISVDTDGYYVSFDYTPDCGGTTACSMGSFSAIRGTQIEPKSSYSKNDVYKYIKLNNGYHAVLINSCGAYCNAMIAWKISDIVYTIYIKNGTEEEVIRIANSVYN